jgi:hypothetical protein
MLLAFAIGAWFALSIVSGPLVGLLLRARGLASSESDSEWPARKRAAAHSRLR